MRDPRAGAVESAAHGRSNGTGDGGHSHYEVPTPDERTTDGDSRTPLLSGAVAATPAVRVLERAKVAHTLHSYDPDHPADQGYGEAAVAALGSDPRQVFKTLVARVDGVLTVAVVRSASAGSASARPCRRWSTRRR